MKQQLVGSVRTRDALITILYRKMAFFVENFPSPWHRATECSGSMAEETSYDARGASSSLDYPMSISAPPPPPPILLHIFAYIHFGIRMLGSWRSRCHNFYGQTPLRSQHTYVIFLKLTHVFWQACDTIWSFSVQHIHSWTLMTTYGIIIQLDHVDLYPPTLT